MQFIRDRDRAPDLEGFLSRPLFAHLATASENGPRNSPVWFLWESSALWVIGSRRDDTFPKRVRQDPRCAVGIVDFDARTGFVEHVGMRGRATLAPFDPQLARRLLRRYLGAEEQLWDVRFKDALTDPDSLLIRFVPETVVVRDVSYQIGDRGAPKQ